MDAWLPYVVAAAAALLSYFLPKIVARVRRPKPPPAPRGQTVVVFECVELVEATRKRAEAAAATAWIACHGNFGAQIKAARRVRAADDASFCAIVTIDPLKNFEALDGSTGPAILDGYLRALGRCGGGLVDVYVVLGDARLARVERRGFFASPSIELVADEDDVPASARAVVAALRAS